MKFSNSVEKKYEGINQLKQKGTPNIYYKKTQNICSLKTQKYNIPKDVYIFDTYQNMLKEIDLIFPAMPKKEKMEFREKNNKNMNQILELKNEILIYKNKQNELSEEIIIIKRENEKNKKIFDEENKIYKNKNEELIVLNNKY